MSDPVPGSGIQGSREAEGAGGGGRPPPGSVAGLAATPGSYPASVPIMAPTKPDDPRLSAGVELTKVLFYMVSVSIVVLVLILAVMDWRYATSVDAVAERALLIAQYQVARPDGSKLDGILALLGEARTGKTAPQPSQLEDANAAIAEFRRIGMLSSAQADRVARCLRTASITPPLVKPEVDDCVQILTTVRNAASGSTDVERLRIARELSKEAREHHQAFRAFWTQAAGLILLNLLLPVLTALLGYIFGSRQGERSA